jgi:hypothetical protein
LREEKREERNGVRRKREKRSAGGERYISGEGEKGKTCGWGRKVR